MRTFEEYLRDAHKYGSLGKAALHWQCKHENTSEAECIRRMHERLKVMKDSAQAGLSPTLRSVSGMVGGQAARMADPAQVGRFGLIGKASAYALSIAEYNACMGKIVAAPTAGSCGMSVRAAYLQASDIGIIRANIGIGCKAEPCAFSNLDSSAADIKP